MNNSVFLTNEHLIFEKIKVGLDLMSLRVYSNVINPVSSFPINTFASPLLVPALSSETFRIADPID
jgi:hypothetical protein